MTNSRGLAFFNTDNFPRQNDQDSNTYVVGGLLLAVALANSGCYACSYDLGCRRESSGSSGGTVEFDAISQSLQRLFFRSLLFAHSGTAVKWPQILALYSTLNQPRALSSPPDTRCPLCPHWSPWDLASTEGGLAAGINASVRVLGLVPREMTKY